MASEFEFPFSTTSETNADMVREVGRSLEGAIRDKYNTWKKQVEAGEDEASMDTFRALTELRRELRRFKETYPEITWDSKAPTTPIEDLVSGPSRTLPSAIVVSALIIAGVILLSVVLVTGANWYYAEMIFVLAAYLVWQHWL